ncbi:MAG: hypothetical protein WBW41_04845 [Verrucomicrobiia bacterium]
MNTPLEAPAGEAERVDLRHDAIGVAWNAFRIFQNEGSPAPLWLKARARAIGFRRDDLERTHWKKVCRSMVVD